MTEEPGLASWLQLTLTPGLGAASLRAMLKQFGLPQAILQRKRSELAAFASAEALAALESSAVREAAGRSLEWARAPGHAIITLADEGYPRSLLEIADPPALLYAAGRVELASRPALAVVGSRNASAQGEHNAEGFARALSDAGLTIISGLALGIDAAAHRGGLAGASSTIAVLGTGIDVTYPQRNAGLATEISGRGLLLSEFPPGAPPAAHSPRVRSSPRAPLPIRVGRFSQVPARSIRRCPRAAMPSSSRGRSWSSRPRTYSPSSRASGRAALPRP